MTGLTLEEAEAKLDKIVSEFNEKLTEAECLADTYNLSFSIRPTYGMGGTYGGRVGQWYASSESC